MKKLSFFLFILFLFAQSCELDEAILDEALNSDLLNGSGAAEGIITPVYARMYNVFNGHEGISSYKKVRPMR